MFIRYITEKDVFESGFILNPLSNETFSRQKIDNRLLSTYMQVWNDINSFCYRVVTDREGLIERGTISSKEVLRELVDKFFVDDVDAFLKRNISKLKHFNNEKFLESLNCLDRTKKENVMINLFGEGQLYVKQ